MTDETCTNWEDVERIIYLWRRYEGHHLENEKSFSFSDMDLLERRIKAYFKNPAKFNFDKPEMGVYY